MEGFYFDDMNEFDIMFSKFWHKANFEEIMKYTKFEHLCFIQPIISKRKIKQSDFPSSKT